ncbi:transcriptional regulator [Actinoplanes sichuanensis]|uniref:TetR/AcrR family transcriptional regulator n=1 Tax=Actinoplanes sichuanensis TaxID=512349 RepID=A0ABW4A7V3_9ACTN|nr:TetR/AcrR family transcriptional regulator [Actinoplanes sichuanensis]BEL03342.1 transcriptional regulator [Actinoplanes sichuanensis]
MNISPTAGRELYAGRSREQRESERYDKIVAAAVHLFATRDFDEVTVADVCAEAKVSKRYFYHHFTDRADLLFRVHTAQNAWLLDALVAAGPPSGTVEELVTPVMHTLTRLLREHPERARVIYINAPRMELRRRGLLREEAVLLGDLILRSGGEPADLRLFERAVLALVAGATELIIEWVVQDFTEPAEELADHLTRIAVSMLAGVAVTPEPV